MRRILPAWNAQIAGGSLEIIVLEEDIGSSWYEMMKNNRRQITMLPTVELQGQCSPRVRNVYSSPEPGPSIGLWT